MDRDAKIKVLEAALDDTCGRLYKYGYCCDNNKRRRKECDENCVECFIKYHTKEGAETVTAYIPELLRELATYKRALENEALFVVENAKIQMTVSEYVSEVLQQAKKQLEVEK